MNPHLKAIPSLGTLTTRRLAGGDFQNLSRESDGALNTKVLGFGTLNQVRGNFSKKKISYDTLSQNENSFKWEKLKKKNIPFSKD